MVVFAHLLILEDEVYFKIWSLLQYATHHPLIKFHENPNIIVVFKGYIYSEQVWAHI